MEPLAATHARGAYVAATKQIAGAKVWLRCGSGVCISVGMDPNWRTPLALHAPALIAPSCAQDGMMDKTLMFDLKLVSISKPK